MDEGRSIKPEEIHLDLRGLKCPLPALKTRAALARLSPHAILVVAATDPLAAVDIPHLIHETGDEMVEQNVDGPLLIFRIRKTAGSRARSALDRRERRDGAT